MESNTTSNTQEINTNNLENDLETRFRISQLKILEIFHKEGSTAAMPLVISWLVDVERWAEKDRTHRRMVILEMKRADFYLAEQNTEGALACLKDAATIADNEDHLDLLDTVEWKIDAVKKVSQKIFGEVI